MNSEELKQNAKITNKDIKINLKYCTNLSSKIPKLTSSMINVPITIRAKGIIILI
jgi:hypothetical protein